MRGTWPQKADNLVNHVIISVDMSGSMDASVTHGKSRRDVAVEMVDGQLKELAEVSLLEAQETRITIFVFDQTVTCAIFDMDVVRVVELGSVGRFFQPRGLTTALIDATMAGIVDMRTIQAANIYGRHSYVFMTVTDGGENASRRHSLEDLSRELKSLSGEWTFTIMVPDENCKAYALKAGYHEGNILVFDASTEEGFRRGAEAVKTSTRTYFTARAAGATGTREFFSTAGDAVNSRTLSVIPAVPPSDFQILDVPETGPMGPFVQDLGITFIKGQWYYQLTKTEDIQNYKKVAFVNRNTGEVRRGTWEEGRAIVGLPSAYGVRVKPDKNWEWDVFVQSTSPGNRKLPKGSRILRFPKEV